MAKNSAAGLLTLVDSMFTTQEERDDAQRSYVTDLPAAEISNFPKVWLGYSDISTTSNIYTHLDYNSKVASANAILGVYPTAV